MSKAVYAGTFDPFTLGHDSVLEAASKLFDEVVLAVARDTGKATLLRFDERLALARDVAARHPNVRAEGFEGLLAHYLGQTGIFTLVRGLRNGTDFDYETAMAHANETLEPRIHTVYLAARGEAALVSGTLVREIYRLGGDVTHFVPPEVAAYLARRPR